MPKIKFSKSVFDATTRNKLNKEILTSFESSPEMRKEIKRVFQQANRRIQNIEQTGQFSPAVMSLNKGDIKGYTKFSMRGTWDDLKVEYGKAISFLRQPTSTASGTRQYSEHLRKSYDLTENEFNMMSSALMGKLNSLSDTDFVDKYLMRYKDFTGDLEQSAKDISTQIESEAESVARALQTELSDTASDAVQQIDETIQQMLSDFSDFGL